MVVALLKGSGDDLSLDAQDKQNTSALMAACQSGQLDTVSLLLDHRADATLQDRSGLTALHHSASCGHDLVVKALLQQPDGVVQALAGTPKPVETPAGLGNGRAPRPFHPT